MILIFLTAAYTQAIVWIASSKAAILINNKFIFAALILLLSVMMGKLFLFIVERVVLVFTSRTKTRLDDLIIEKTRRPLFYILILSGVSLAFSQLSLNDMASSITHRIIASLILFIFAIAVNRVVGVLIDVLGKKWAEKTTSTLDDELLPLFRKVSTVVLFVMAFIFILKIWKVDITGLLAGLGVAGIAIGFALQDSLKNIFGGVFLILDKNIKVGDRVKLDSGEIGEVMDIGLRSTRIKTFDNEMIIIPNGNMATNKIQNLVLPDVRQRVNVKFSIAYGTKIETVEKVIIEAISKVNGMIKDPAPVVVFLEMGDFSLNFVCRFWINNYNNSEAARSSANRLIYEALNKAGIEIPFPTRHLYIKKE